MKTTTADARALPKRNAASGRFEKGMDRAAATTKKVTANVKPAAKAKPAKPAAAKGKKA